MSLHAIRISFKRRGEYISLTQCTKWSRESWQQLKVGQQLKAVNEGDQNAQF
jgi:hypothetical protein